MPSINLKSGRVFYRELGEGPVMLMLHANPGDSRDFSAVMPTLAKEFRVIALDWPGYGQSPFSGNPADASASAYYEVLKDFISLLDLTQLFLIGSSVGGNAAARYAIDFPANVRGLILVAPGGFTNHNFLTRSFCKLQGSRFALPPRIWARSYLRRRTKTSLEMIERAGREQASSSSKKVNQAIWRSFIRSDHDLRLESANIKSPTLLLFGQFDLAIPANKDGVVARQCIPGAKFVILPCGHASYAELPEMFLDELLPFCRLAFNTWRKGVRHASA
jgi:pimeloyl-ACP methyl ester carboxylesterase